MRARETVRQHKIWTLHPLFEDGPCSGKRLISPYSPVTVQGSGMWIDRDTPSPQHAAVHLTFISFVCWNTWVWDVLLCISIYSLVAYYLLFLSIIVRVGVPENAAVLWCFGGWGQLHVSVNSAQTVTCGGSLFSIDPTGVQWQPFLNYYHYYYYYYYNSVAMLSVPVGRRSILIIFDFALNLLFSFTLLLLTWSLFY